MIKNIYILLFILTVPTGLLAQSSNVAVDALYDRQFTYGINLNTNQGLLGGFSFRYSKHAGGKRYHSFSLEIVDIKHPKEDKTSSPITGDFYVPGKSNSLFVIRPQFGQELVLFRKAQQKGVQVNAVAALGPTIGLVSPYLIEYKFPNGDRRTEQYDPTVHTSFNEILGAGNFGEGLSMARLRIGTSLKLSLVFEYSSLRNNLLGLEAGFMTDVFNKKVVIMSLAKNHAVYTSAFLTFFYGIGK